MNMSMKHPRASSGKSTQRPRVYHNNKHHRLPRSAGGGAGEGNLVTVPFHHHVAYHKLFHAHSPSSVAQQLNERWLPLSTVMVCVPTARITEALALLQAAGIIPGLSLADRGITEKHLQFHGTLAEQEERAPWWTKHKRPD